MGLLETPSVARAAQSCEGAHEAPRGSAHDSRAGPPRTSGGERLGGTGRGRHSGRPGGVRSPPGAASYAWPQPRLRRPGPRAAWPHSRLGPRQAPRCPPPHDPRSLTPGPGSSSASSSSSSRRAGMASTLSWLRAQPASSGGRCGRAGRGRGGDTATTARRWPGFS